MRKHRSVRQPVVCQALAQLVRPRILHRHNVVARKQRRLHRYAYVAVRYVYPQLVLAALVFQYLRRRHSYPIAFAVLVL